MHLFWSMVHFKVVYVTFRSEKIQKYCCDIINDKWLLKNVVSSILLIFWFCFVRNVYSGISKLRKKCVCNFLWPILSYFIYHDLLMLSAFGMQHRMKTTLFISIVDGILCYYVLANKTLQNSSKKIIQTWQR